MTGLGGQFPEYIQVLFGQRLKVFRKQVHLTQAEVAAKTGLSEDYISLLERGRNQPTLAIVLALQGALDVASLEEFLGDFPSATLTADDGGLESKVS
jgi:transcriptional regulator with XRE-family HTH domain